MTLPTKKFRELVFQLLYALDKGLGNREDLIPMIMREAAITKKRAYEVLHRAEEVYAHRIALDAKLAAISTEYHIERIQSVEKNILRLGAYEILHDLEIPNPVAIAEALRLTKKFSTPEAVAFVNALLDPLQSETT